MLKTAAALMLLAALAACGGGDDGDGASELVRQTIILSKADLPDNSMASSWSATIQSDQSAATVSGPYTVVTCVKGTWRQTLRNSPAVLRLRLNGRTITDSFAGVVGAENRIPFSGCSEVTGNASDPIKPSGNAVVEVMPETNRAALPLSGYEVTAEIVVTRTR